MTTGLLLLTQWKRWLSDGDNLLLLICLLMRHWENEHRWSMTNHSSVPLPPLSSWFPRHLNEKTGHFSVDFIKSARKKNKQIIVRAREEIEIDWEDVSSAAWRSGWRRNIRRLIWTSFFSDSFFLLFIVPGGGTRQTVQSPSYLSTTTHRQLASGVTLRNNSGRLIESCYSPWTLFQPEVDQLINPTCRPSHFLFRSSHPAT